MDSADLDEAGLSARRFFCPALLGDGWLELDEAAAQHARVLRLGPGDRVELFDGQGHRRAARIERLSKGKLHCVAQEPPQFEPRGPELVLVQCLPKGKKLDDVVRMTSELGVAGLQLAISERCVAQRSARDEHKVERLTRIAVEAARQAEQPYVPHITEPASLEEVVARAPDNATRLALTERSPSEPFFAAQGSPVWLVVGPEGGLSIRDRAILSRAGFRPVGLGRAILRTETAAVVGVALGLSALGWRR